MAAPGDDVYIDAGNVSATISSATGGNFESLAINPAAATTAITDTIATTTVSLTATASVAEGGNITYTASLNNPAQTAVTRHAEQRRDDQHRGRRELGHGQRGSTRR